MSERTRIEWDRSKKQQAHNPSDEVRTDPRDRRLEDGARQHRDERADASRRQGRAHRDRHEDQPPEAHGLEGKEQHSHRTGLNRTRDNAGADTSAPSGNVAEEGEPQAQPQRAAGSTRREDDFATRRAGHGDSYGRANSSMQRPGSYRSQREDRRPQPGAYRNVERGDRASDRLNDRSGDRGGNVAEPSTRSGRIEFLDPTQQPRHDVRTDERHKGDQPCEPSHDRRRGDRLPSLDIGFVGREGNLGGRDGGFGGRDGGFGGRDGGFGGRDGRSSGRVLHEHDDRVGTRGRRIVEHWEQEAALILPPKVVPIWGHQEGGDGWSAMGSSRPKTDAPWSSVQDGGRSDGPIAGMGRPRAAAQRFAPYGRRAPAFLAPEPVPPQQLGKGNFGDEQSRTVMPRGKWRHDMFEKEGDVVI